MGANASQKDELRRQILFGYDLGEVSARKLSLATGLSPKKLSAWKKKPWTVTLEGAELIAKARGLSKDQIAELI